MGLFADYPPDEVAVIADWFNRAGTPARSYLAESRENGALTVIELVQK
ncbi:hypothetical protein ABZ532_26475 [Streptomyces sp. NPDC019396]